MSFLSRFLRATPPAAAPTVADENLILGARWNDEARVQDALVAGGDPNRMIRMEGTEYTAFAVAIQRHNARLVDAFLNRGFVPRLSDVERAVRAVEQQPDFDGHPGEMPAGHDVIRVLFAHGERFGDSSHDPHHPQDTLADNLRRHAPSLGLDWTAPAALPLAHHPELPKAQTPAERTSLDISLGVIAGAQTLASLDSIRHLVARGADPLHVRREIGPTQTLVQIALAGSHTTLLRFCLEHQMWPTEADKAALARRLVPAFSEDDERRSHGHGLSSAHALIRVLLDHGETFGGPSENPRHPEWTTADLIREVSPILARELPDPPGVPSTTAPERRRPRLR